MLSYQIRRQSHNIYYNGFIHNETGVRYEPSALSYQPKKLLMMYLALHLTSHHSLFTIHISHFSRFYFLFSPLTTYH